MRTTAGKLARALRVSLLIIGVILISVSAVFGAVWAIDPPWRVNELRGSVVSWGQQETPNVVLRYYKMFLVVKADN
jgi:hypothetical protein